VTSIDLNCDLGESFGNFHIGNDEEVLGLVTSANIATGFHAGDPLVMLTTVRRAKENSVRIGAHVGYRDLPGFGRRFIDYDLDQLTAEVLYQIGALQAACRATGTEVEYVKPHGALYNRIARDAKQAQAVIAGMKLADPQLALMGLAGSPVLGWAEEAGLPTISETFADRAYEKDGSLVPRSQPGAIHDSDEKATEQALNFALGKPITAVDGSDVQVVADSICVHGDNPHALHLVRAIRDTLSHNGIAVSS